MRTLSCRVAFWCFRPDAVHARFLCSVGAMFFVLYTSEFWSSFLLCTNFVITSKCARNRGCGWFLVETRYATVGDEGGDVEIGFNAGVRGRPGRRPRRLELGRVHHGAGILSIIHSTPAWISRPARYHQQLNLAENRLYGAGPRCAYFV
jgi:hypothetical protein